jgi:hypothetical protein
LPEYDLTRQDVNHGLVSKVIVFDKTPFLHNLLCPHHRQIHSLFIATKNGEDVSVIGDDYYYKCKTDQAKSSDELKNKSFLLSSTLNFPSTSFG